VCRERKPPLSPRHLTSTCIWIRISGLIRIRIWVPAGSFQRCCGFIILSASVISPSVGDCMRNAINLLKSPTPQWWRKWKCDLESVSGTGSPTKVKPVLIGRPKVSMKLAHYFCSNPAHKMPDRMNEQTDRQTVPTHNPALLVPIIIIIIIIMSTLQLSM